MYKVVYNACYGGFGLSEEAIQYLKDKHGLNPNEEFERHDKRLVDVVEALGDKANGFCAKLAIAEIESRMYRIDEYDGYESVEAPDSYEWININD